MAENLAQRTDTTQGPKGSPRELPSLIFPSDLEGANEFYPEAIRFTIYQRQSIDIHIIKEDVAQNFAENQGRTLTRSSKPPESVQKKLNAIGGNKGFVAPGLENKEFEDAANAQTNIANGQEPKEEQNLFQIAKSGVSTALSSAGRQLQSQTPAELSKREIRSIYLAMPAAVQYNESVDWEGTDLGAIVGGALSGNSTGALGAGALDSVGSILGGAVGGVLAGGVAGAVLGTILGASSSLGGAVESVFDVKANPYKEQTFQGVGFRPFEFSFTFRPRNETEVQTVLDIITSFRAYSKPSFRTAGQAGLFAYPKEFRIEFLVKEGDKEKNSPSGARYVKNSYIPEIKFCVLKSVATNYTGQGWVSLEGGAPADITLSLSFEETEIVTQEDVFGETSVGDFTRIGGNF